MSEELDFGDARPHWRDDLSDHAAITVDVDLPELEAQEAS
jgi:hypothetical protein